MVNGHSIIIPLFFYLPDIVGMRGSQGYVTFKQLVADDYELVRLSSLLLTLKAVNSADESH